MVKRAKEKEFDYDLTVKVSYKGKDIEATKKILLQSFDTDTFWIELRETLEEAFIQKVKNITGEEIPFQLHIEENAVMRAIRKNPAPSTSPYN